MEYYEQGSVCISGAEQTHTDTNLCLWQRSRGVLTSSWMFPNLYDKLLCNFWIFKPLCSLYVTCKNILHKCDIGSCSFNNILYVVEIFNFHKSNSSNLLVWNVLLLYLWISFPNSVSQLLSCRLLYFTLTCIYRMQS